MPQQYFANTSSFQGVSGCITKAFLDQAQTTGYPITGFGLVVRSQNAPDVITYPEMKAFLWLELNGSGEATGNEYYYDDALSSWELRTLVDGSQIADHSIPLDKLTLSGAVPGNIIQVNGDGTGYSFVTPQNAIANNTLDVSKLAIAIPGNNLLFALAGTKVWLGVSNILNYIGTGGIPIAKIAGGGAGNLILTSQSGTVAYADGDTVISFVSDGGVALSKISGTGFAIGQGIQWNGTGWIPYTLPTAYADFASTTIALPASNAVVSFTHGLGGTPTGVRWVLSCITPQYGYTAGDEIEVGSFLLLDTGGQPTVRAFSERVNNIQCQLICLTTAAIHVLKNDGTFVSAAITLANWQVKVYAERKL